MRSHLRHVVAFTLVVPLLFLTTSCKELRSIMSGECCCYPTISTASNDGHLKEPKDCSNPDYYCAGNSPENSAPERQSYAQHCGNVSILQKLNDPIAFSSHAGWPVSSLGFKASVVSRPRDHARPVDQPEPSQCEAECSANGAFCLKVNLEDQNGMVSKVKQARELILDTSRDRIKKTQFMQIFGVGDDPCDRKDTFLSASQITNEGESCFLNSSISNDKGSFKFTVHLPATLQGSRIAAANKVTLIFDEKAKSPALSIGDPDLDRDFGGRVERATATSDSGVIATERGCIAVKTQPRQ